MGIKINCDWCGRELVYHRGWVHTENGKIRCLGCSEVLNLYVVTTKAQVYLANMISVMSEEGIEREFAILAQDLNNRLTDVLEQLMLPEGEIIL